MKHTILLLLALFLSSCYIPKTSIKIKDTTELSEKNKNKLNSNNPIWLTTRLVASEKYILPHLEGKKITQIFWYPPNQQAIDTSFLTQLPLAKKLAFDIEFHATNITLIGDPIVYDSTALRSIYANISPQSLGLTFCYDNQQKFFYYIIPYLKKYKKLKKIYFFYSRKTPNDTFYLKKYHFFLESLPHQQMQEVTINNTEESDTLPSVFFAMKNLKKLGYSGGHINYIPEEIGVLKKLRSLSLNRQNLSSFPSSISNLTNMRALALGSNKIEVFPDWILKFKKLRFLDLAHNQIKTIPKEITQLKKLKHLYLMGNPIPTEEIEALEKALPNTYIYY